MAEDINISPDMINNLVNMLKNSSNSSSNANSETNSTAETKNESENNQANNIDFETIMKIKSIMESLNSKNDSKSNLLYSLKPYLRKSKQDKLDQYVNIMKISQVANLFKNEKGDTK